MALIEFDFPSANGRDTIHSWIYEPVVPARAVVQIIHGLGEHSRRYLPLIVRLLDEGFVVAAGDHAGHGKTAMHSGVWADAGDDAARVVIEDEETIRAHVRAMHPTLPCVVFGHSWGSMIARSLVSASDGAVDGLVLGGIAAQMLGIERQLDRAALAAVEDPQRVADAFIPDVFAGFVSRYGDDAGPTDWVARDADVVRDHASDPLNNFGAPMTVRFLRGFVELYDDVNSDAWYGRIRAELPVLILAGDGDPVANYGEGAYHVANRLIDSGHPDVRVRVYPGVRHEVHNEPGTRDDVVAEVVAFVNCLVAH